MTINERIKAFSELGKTLRNNALSKEIKLTAEQNNKWFIQENIDMAINEIAVNLTEDKLKQWLENYSCNSTGEKTVGVVMAGNIPLVGFHDFLSVLICGHKIMAKLSSKDKFLLPAIADLLIKINPEFKEKIFFTDSKLSNIDAIIATGSDNSAKYFEYYFGKYPNIIRKNRTSVALLTGNENNDDLYRLGFDILSYFGLGCRNVSKLFVPENYDFTKFFEAIEPHSKVYINNKYANNYDYNKSIYLMNKTKHLDNGFLILKQDFSYNSPVGVVFYEEYKNLDTIKKRLEHDKEKLQVIISNTDNYTKFGQSQSPALDDYADGIDTLEFLQKL